MTPNPNLGKPRKELLTPDKSVEPGFGTLMGQVLAAVRSKPGQRTSYYARECGLTQAHARQQLLLLVRRKLIGRQEGFGMGNYESTWTPEVTT